MVQPMKQEAPLFLVPLDGSHLAESVLPTLEQLVRRIPARVLLLHIMEQHAPATIHGERHLTDYGEAEAYLNEVAARLRSTGLAVETHVHDRREHDIAGSIFQHAHESNAKLVIMCTHGGGGLRGFLFGSIAQQALQVGTRSILLVFPGAKGSEPALNLRRILVPLDGTAAHEPALPAALTLARAFGAELCLVFVVPTLATLAGEQAVSGLLLPGTTKAVLDLVEQEAKNYLEQTLAQCRAAGVTARAEVLRGDVVSTVLRLAEQLDIDLIVMATHGRAGLDALLRGSVASRISGRFRHPLLLLRVDGTGDEES